MLLYVKPSSKGGSCINRSLGTFIFASILGKFPHGHELKPVSLSFSLYR